MSRCPIAAWHPSDYAGSSDPARLATIAAEDAVVPEAMLRGHFRRACGPGWALVGDAGHFEHPAAAQGIGDAIEQGVYVADAVTGRDPDLATFAAWRDDAVAEHYEWSFELGRWPVEHRDGTCLWRARR